MKNEYTINEINADGNVVVTFAIDGKKQILTNAPTDSADDLKTYLCDYLSAYSAGKEIETPTISKDVKDLVGKKLTVEEV